VFVPPEKRLLGTQTMKNKIRVKKVLVLMGVGFTALAMAQTVTRPRIAASHRLAAERLLDAMQMETVATEAAARTILEFLAAHPVWRAHRDVLVDYVEERIGWEALKPDVAQIYAETFTERELGDLTRFYQTPAGRKLAEQASGMTLRLQAAARERLAVDLSILELQMKNRVLDDLLELGAFAPEPPPEPRQ